MSYRDVPEALRSLARLLDDEQQESLPLTLEHRRRLMVRKLLASEEADAGLLNYNLESFHLGIVASGPDPGEPLRDLRGGLSSRLLLVAIDDGTTWAWLGGSERVVSTDLDCLRRLEWPEGTAIACGEPAEGLDGWRLTHRQAAAALPVARHSPGEVVHHPDVALLASALRDDLLASSLRHAYLDPLEDDRDEGVTAKDTLRAYFKASRQASSAASELRVDRSTVTNRLRAIEARLGRPLNSVSAELEVALRLDEIANRDNTHQEVAIC